MNKLREPLDIKRAIKHIMAEDSPLKPRDKYLTMCMMVESEIDRVKLAGKQENIEAERRAKKEMLEWITKNRDTVTLVQIEEYLAISSLPFYDTRNTH